MEIETAVPRQDSLTLLWSAIAAITRWAVCHCDSAESRERSVVGSEPIWSL